jgi:hypothetical protein
MSRANQEKDQKILADDRRDELNFLLFLLNAAGQLATRLPTAVPVASQIHDTIAEVEFLQALLDADAALFDS